jgi:hypothetical protein
VDAEPTPAGGANSSAPSSARPNVDKAGARIAGCLVLVLIGMGLLSIVWPRLWWERPAFTPPPGTPATAEAAFEAVLTAASPVSQHAIVISFTGTVPPSTTVADLVLDQTAIGDPAFRIAIVPNDPSVAPAFVDRSQLPSGATGIRLTSFGAAGTGQSPENLRVIVELVDPTRAPLTIHGVLRATVTPYKEGDVAPKGSIAIQDTVTVAGRPVEASGSATGDAVFDADHPVAITTVSVHLDPALGTDRASLVPTATAHLDRSTPSVSVEAWLGRDPTWAPPLGAASDTVWREDPDAGKPGLLRLTLPPPATCTLPNPCDYTYVLSFAVSGSAVSTSVHWEVDVGLVDYAPSVTARDAVAMEARTESVDPSGGAVTRTISGHSVVSGNGQGDRIDLRVTLDRDALSGFNKQGLLPVLTAVATVTALENGAPRVRADGPVRIDPGGTFAADGIAHLFSRSGWSCQPPCRSWPEWASYPVMLGFNLRAARADADIAFPITIDWTVEVRLQGFASHPLPSGTGLDLAVATPK